MELDRVPRVAALATVALPLVGAVVFFVLRDVPPANSCGGGTASPGELAAYRSGSIVLAVVAEVLAIAAYAALVAAERRAETPGGRYTSGAVAAAAGTAAALAATVPETDDALVLALLIVLVVTVPVLAVLRRVLRLGGSVVAAAAATLGAAVLVVSFPVLAFFGVLLAPISLGTVALVTVGVTLAAFTRDDLDFARGAARLLAVLVGVLLVPLGLAVIWTRGDLPLLC